MARERNFFGGYSVPSMLVLLNSLSLSYSLARSPRVPYPFGGPNCTEYTAAYYIVYCTDYIRTAWNVISARRRLRSCLLASLPSLPTFLPRRRKRKERGHRHLSRMTKGRERIDLRSARGPKYWKSTTILTMSPGRKVEDSV